MVEEFELKKLWFSWIMYLVNNISNFVVIGYIIKKNVGLVMYLYVVYGGMN